MITKSTVLEVADNSGAIKARCIGIPGKGTGCFTGNIGDIITVSIIDADPKGKVSKGEVKRGVVVRTRAGIIRADGSKLIFSDNALVIINENHDMVGTRIMGVVPRELKDKNFSKIVSLAQEVL